MALSVKCPRCGTVHQVGPEMAGTRAQCRCGAVVVVPQLKRQSAPPPAGVRMLDDDMLGPAPAPQPEEPEVEPVAAPRPKSTWKYAEPKKRTTGRQVFRSVAALLAALCAIPFGAFMAASHVAGAQLCLQASQDADYVEQFGTLIPRLQLVANAVLVLPATAMLIAGIGILLGGIFELAGSTYRTPWADVAGAIAGAAYVCIVFLSLLIGAGVDLFLVAGASVDADAIAGRVMSGAFWFLIGSIVPAILVVSYQIRSKK